MQTLWQDLRHGTRALLGSPGFAALAVAALALGIGANTAVFSAVHAVLLEPLPFAEPDRLVMVFDVQPEVPQAPASFPIYVDWRDETRVFDGVGGWTAQGKVLTGAGDPARLRTGVVTDTLLPTLGVPPVAGRWFTEDEDQPNGPKAVILGYATWQQRFGGDPAVVGRSITLDAQPHTVVGIMPAGFDFPSRSEIWVTLQRAFDKSQRGSHFLRVVARMTPDVSFAQAKTEMEALGTRLTERTGHAHGVTIARLDEMMIGGTGRPLVILLGAVSFVLLIACVNVANLLLARAVARQRELAIRTALGAAPGRLVRQFLTESVLLGVAGGALGVALASWLVREFVSLAPPSYPRLSAIGLDPTVLGFTLAVSVVTGVVFGLVPALLAAGADPSAALREGGGKSSASGARRVTRLLVTIEIALALVLVVGAGLMGKSLTRLEREQTGLRADHLLTFRLDLTSARYQEPANVRAFFHDLVARLGGIAGVEAVGAIHMLPLQSWGWNGVPTIEGHPGWPEGQEPLAEYRVVTPDYFRTMGIPLVRGRTFTDRDTEAATPVLLINEAAAKRFFPGEDPVGRRMRGGFASQFAEIVGVVADVRQARLDLASRAEVYFPHDQAPWTGMSVAVRAGGRDPLALVPAVRQQVADLDPDLPVTAVSTMERVVADSARQPRLSSVLIGLFAALAALLAVVGIYGVMSYSVTQRTREIGIRVAVGAGAGAVVGLVLREALALAVAGLVFGLAAAFGLTRLLSSQLYQVSATDPLVLGAAAVAILAVSLTAGLVPAWRALRVDPLIALRAE